MFPRATILTTALAIAGLYGCNATKTKRVPFPLQEGVCDFFDTTQYMREYWIGIRDWSGYPDVKVRIPSEYMDFRLRRFAEAGRLDGAIGFGLRPLDFAPSQGYVGVQEYPDGPIDPERPKYKTSNGGILMDHPRFVSENVRIHSLGVGDLTPFADIIKNGIVSDEHPDLLIIKNESVLRRLKDILIFAPDGEITAYFICSKREWEFDGTYANVGCTMYTNMLPVSVKLSFDRDFLPEWRSLLSKTEGFVECMILETGDAERQ